MLVVLAAVTSPLPGNAATPDHPQVPVPRFEIDEYIVDGNTTLPQIDVEAAVYPFLGPDRSETDIEAARAALEAAYRRRGFQTVAVTAPEATPASGSVHLSVSETPVGRLHVAGAEYHSPDDIKAAAPSLTPGTVPNFTAVEADVAGLNRLPGRTVTPELKPGHEPGTLDVDLKVEDQQPLHASVEINNRQSQSTSELRVQGSVSYDNLWQLGHSISLTYQTAPENTDDAEVWVATYTARFADSPLALAVTGIVSNSNVAALGGTDVIGNGEVVSARLSSPLPGTTKFTEAVFGEIAYKHFLDSTILTGLSADTPVTYYPLTLGYTAGYAEADATDAADASITFASPQLGSPSAEFDDKRYLARGQNLYLKADASRLQQLPLGAEGYVRIGGQITDQPLITNEQYAAGGQDTVRGYLEAEVLGDYGYLGSAELRSPNLDEVLGVRSTLGEVFQELRATAFIDGGELFLHSPLPEQRAYFPLWSVGVGARLKMLDHLNGTLDLAFPQSTASLTKAGSERLLFRVWSDL